MGDSISLIDIYDKDLNFLLGSGASFGLFPTLGLQIAKDSGSKWSLEDLGTHLDAATDPRLTSLFMHYYTQCISPAERLTLASTVGDAKRSAVIDNYRRFLGTLLKILLRRRPQERRCNLFTTNYDGCLPLVCDELIREGSIDFVLNDGARGFSRRYVQARNFNTYLSQTGIFERNQTIIPQINLIHLHGSVYWSKHPDESSIIVDYSKEPSELLTVAQKGKLEPFSKCLETDGKTLDDLKDPSFTSKATEKFWSAYKSLPIVNPTKWKFHETVFEEHYYQMLRLLSYELEKPNAVLITFGFSFADEHVRNLLKRSLANSKLQVFVCCFNAPERLNIENMFKGSNNVKCISLDSGVLDFSAFNDQVFTSDEGKTVIAGVAASPSPAGFGAGSHAGSTI